MQYLLFLYLYLYYARKRLLNQHKYLHIYFIYKYIACVLVCVRACAEHLHEALRTVAVLVFFALVKLCMRASRHFERHFCLMCFCDHYRKKNKIKKYSWLCRNRNLCWLCSLCFSTTSSSFARWPRVFACTQKLNTFGQFPLCVQRIECEHARKLCLYHAYYICLYYIIYVYIKQYRRFFCGCRHFMQRALYVTTLVINAHTVM